MYCIKCKKATDTSNVQFAVSCYEPGVTRK